MEKIWDCFKLVVSFNNNRDLSVTLGCAISSSLCQVDTTFLSCFVSWVTSLKNSTVNPPKKIHQAQPLLQPQNRFTLTHFCWVSSSCIYCVSATVSGCWLFSFFYVSHKLLSGGTSDPQNEKGFSVWLHWKFSKVCVPKSPVVVCFVALDHRTISSLSAKQQSVGILAGSWDPPLSPSQQLSVLPGLVLVDVPQQLAPVKTLQSKNKEVKKCVIQQWSSILKRFWQFYFPCSRRIGYQC